MAPKLKDMKITKEEREEKQETMAVPSMPEFPYGLNLRFDEDVIEKLGMDKLPNPGNFVMVMAKAKVESASIRKDANDKKQRSLSLQIVKMDVSAEIEADEEGERMDEPKEGGGRPSPEKVLFND